MASLFTLNVSGVFVALIFGVLILALGLGMWWFFMAVLIDFLVLSAIATKAKDEVKMHMKGYEKTRSWKNVTANGLVPVVLVVAYFFNSVYFTVPTGVLVFAFIASVCAITADKFASEFGVLDGEPIMLLTMKPTRKGRSGAVTGFGTLMGAVASLLIGITAFAIGGSLSVFVVVVVSGIFGNVVDSVFGYFEEKGIGNKYTSNLMCAIGGAALCSALFLILPSLL